MIDKVFLAKTTILYVEDDEDSRIEITEVFENFFKEVLVARDGFEALEIYKESIENQKEIDVIISDINMPNINGLELLEEVRQLSKEIPFIFTTAYLDSPKLLKAIKYNITSYVLKPVNVTKLILEIQEYAKQINEEEKNKINNNELGKYLENLASIVLMLKMDKQGLVTSINQPLLDVLREKKENIIGKPYSRLMESKDSLNSITELFENIEAGNIYKGKIKFKTKKELGVYLDVMVLPMYEDKYEKTEEYIHIGFVLPSQEQNSIKHKKMSLHAFNKNNKLSKKEIIYEIKKQINKYKHMNMVTQSLEKEKKEIDYELKKIEEYEK